MAAEQETHLDFKHENVSTSSLLHHTKYALDQFWNKPQDTQKLLYHLVKEKGGATDTWALISKTNGWRGWARGH